MLLYKDNCINITVVFHLLIKTLNYFWIKDYNYFTRIPTHFSYTVVFINVHMCV